MLTKSKIKTKRLINNFFLIFATIGIGYFIKENIIVSFLLCIITVLLSNNVDNYNNDLEYGRYKNE